MKKILLLLLTLALVLSIFASCNTSTDNEGTDDKNTPTDAPTDKPTEKPTEQPTEKPTEKPTDDDGKDEGNEDEYDTITIAEALELCGEPGNLTTERYYIRATIVSIDNAQYGAMTIADDTGSIPVYGTYSQDGSIKYSEMEDKPYKGDEVLLYCTLQNYNGTKEVKSAWLISFKHVEIEIDESQYTDMSIADAREAEVGTKIKVDGVVARITYANGMIPMGVYLVDDTQSIYVYDGDLAQRVNIGNKVTVLGSKTYWILDSEKSNAQKFGYKGCCQLEDVSIVEIDDRDGNLIDFAWVHESTVKEIIETPVTENITSSIFKVNALVKKVPGSGFVNYYFFDLDEKTSSYTYSQCNGSDFAWLDAFDGKICTVYLSPLNAKSTPSDCYFRFIPVSVIDEGFTFDTNNTAEHVVKYYGVNQFNASYTGNPAKELVTSVSSELLGFENATLSYTSSNENVVYFTTENDKLIFNCKDAGTATITVKGEYNGSSYTANVTITVNANTDYDTITIEEAKNAEVGAEVIVKGIIGPSVVNKSGFYLFDESGMVSVLVDASVFADIEIGYEVVIKGIRENYQNPGTTHAGQVCLKDCEVLANYYGNHDYHTFDFITGHDVKYLHDLDINDVHSDEVYLITAKIVYDTSNSYSPQYKIEANDTRISLYCSGAKQYRDLLEQFVNQEVTLEIAPCNWNNKSYYAFCALAVHTADGTVVLNELNFQ